MRMPILISHLFDILANCKCFSFLCLNYIHGWLTENLLLFSILSNTASVHELKEVSSVELLLYK